MKSILDPTFNYVHSHLTDIRATFERERQRIEAERQAAAERERHAADHVTQFLPRRRQA